MYDVVVHHLGSHISVIRSMNISINGYFGFPNTKRLSHEWLINTVQAKYRQGNLGKLVSIAIEPFDGNGGHYTSTMERVKMVFTDETGSKQHITTLLAKINKTVENKCEEENNFWNNRTEFEVYANVLRQMEELMVEFNDQRETLWPMIYGHVPYSILLLEDLGQRYNMLSRMTWLDEEHALLCLRSLGRYHAMSRVLIKRGCIGKEYEGKFLLGNRNIFHEKFYNASLRLLSKVMIEKLGRWKSIESSERIGERLKMLAPLVYEKRVELYYNYDKRFDVLNHGDYRSGNIMFKTMEYTGHPTEIKFFDFQLPHINSFAWDIGYIFSVSTDPSVRRALRSELLKAYQQSLADNLKLFNYEGYVPTIEDVKNETDRLALIEFCHMAVTTPIVISSEDRTLEVDKVTTHPAEEAININIYSDKQFFDGIIGDLERAIKLQII